MNINDFKHTFKTGFARSNRFKVFITIPSSIQNQNNHQLEFRCFSAELPGKNITTTERRIYGPPIKLPYSDIIFSESTLSFICSTDLKEKIIFENWINFIINDNFNLQYYKDYVTDIVIFKMDTEGNINMKCKLIDSYPTNINSQKIDWGDNDNYLTLDVNFAYRIYQIE